MTSSDSWPCAALPDADLAPRTTCRVGGTTEWLLEPAHPDEFVEAWRAAVERGFRPRILGGGANLLIADGRHPGVVITTDRMSRLFRPNRIEGEEWFKGAGPEEANGKGADVRSAHAGHPIESGESEETEELVVWAGAPLPGLVRAARELGWSGLEGLVGIPGHVGGGVAMNAGGRWGEFWDVIRSIRVLTPKGEPEDRVRESCRPAYRDGRLDGAIVLGAVLRLERANKLEIRERMREYLLEKSAAQPVTERSSGCIFKNPDPELSDGRSAGELIDACGGKGLRRGDAIVSPKHGNFLINTGAARAADVLELLEAVRTLVADETGIILESEVQLWELPLPR